MHDLTRVSNRQCQNCHKEQFTSFENGHPELGNWPYEQRPHIAFDHASHEVKHFKSNDVAFDCKTCHQSDASNDIVSVTSYDACASCHEKSIRVSLSEGITFFQLPTIDTDALIDIGFDIGQWPVHATGEFDGTLPELMRVLLTADPQGSKALQELGQNFDFFEVDPNDKRQMQTVADLIWATKRLLLELSDNANTTLRSRLSSLLGTEPSEDFLRHLQSDFAGAIFKQSNERWFLDLQEDLRQEFGDSQQHSSPNDPKQQSLSKLTPNYQTSTTAVAASHSENKGWRIDEDRFAITFYPRGHDDPFMAAMLELVTKTRTNSSSSNDTAIRDTQTLLTKTSSIGQCISCHSMNKARSGKLVIHWQGTPSDNVNSAGLTTFSHQPHLIQNQLNDCTHCHKIDPTADFMSSYSPQIKEHDSPPCVSNFSPMTKSMCDSCHNAAAQKDACTTCHDYHGDWDEHAKLRLDRVVRRHELSATPAR